MIGLSCTAGAVLALCGQVRGTLERKGLPQKELDGGRVRIEPDRKSTRLNSSHSQQSRMPSSA